jgi:two-component system, NtrC family, response regulator AtoC
MALRILVVDDDSGMRETLEAVLAADGYEVSTAATGKEALATLKARRIDLMLLDNKMPDCLGTDLIPAIHEFSPETAIIIMTAFGTIKTAVESVKKGAFNFITKPFELDEVRLAINQVADMRAAAQGALAPQHLRENVVLKDIVGTSPKIQALFAVIKKVVDYDVTILICGESGTGKELVAQAIHHNSPRRNNPFIKLNCAALPETLLESELFGYEKGAFTGATNAKPGRFELARGGTLFLDEIGDTSLSMQSKLLRVLQEKEFERVGGKETLKIDVRILAATNKDLKKEVEEKRFREDLFYRLNIVPISLPSLRERVEDIPLLINHFLKELNLLFQKDFTSVAPEALHCLMNYGWPGNVRELRNVLEKAVLLGEGKVITADYLPEEIKKLGDAAPPEAVPQSSSLDEIEKIHIYRMLQEVNWNQTKAAERLNIHRNTLREKIRKFNLKVPDSQQ